MGGFPIQAFFVFSVSSTQLGVSRIQILSGFSAFFSLLKGPGRKEHKKKILTDCFFSSFLIFSVWGFSLGVFWIQCFFFCFFGLFSFSVSLAERAGEKKQKKN